MTAKLAAYWNIAVISPVCAEQQFLDKKVGYVSINMLASENALCLLVVECFFWPLLNLGLSDFNKSVWTFH